MHVLAWPLVALKQPNQLASILEGDAERLRLAHKPKTRQRILAIDTIAVSEALRSRQDTAPFVIANSRRPESRMLCERTYGEGLTL